MVIRVAQPGGFKRHEDFALLRSVEFYFLDAPFLIDIPQNGSVHLHCTHPRHEFMYRGTGMRRIRQLLRECQSAQYQDPAGEAADQEVLR
jgi:hypothetical protein